MMGFGHGHWNRFEVVRRVGDKRRGLCLFGEPAWLAGRFLGNMVVWDMSIFKIRPAPTGGRVMRRTEGKLGGRER